MKTLITLAAMIAMIRMTVSICSEGYICGKELYRQSMNKEC